MSDELCSLAKDWGWFLDLEKYTLEAISPFGDMLLRDADGLLLLLDVNQGDIELSGVSTGDPSVLFPIAFDDSIASDYRNAGLHLSPGKCYGLKIQGVAGGSMEPDNIYVATAAEYISFMGYFHYQIKDIPDGGTVELKVINLRQPKT